MIRTYRYPLLPNLAQETLLERWLVACCDLYNGALQHRRDAWRRQGVRITRYDQQKELTEIRANDPEWTEIPVLVARSALIRLDDAFGAFFRRLRSGQAPGFPRFRSQDRYDSFDFGSEAVRVNGDRVRVHQLGHVKFHKYREMRGSVRHVTISRSARNWYISFACDLGDAPTKVPVRSAIGIDVGLEAFATLSNGERTDNPRFFRVSEGLIAQRQRSLSRKKRGSNSRSRTKKLVARAYEHVKNQRLDFARKLACMLFNRFDLVVYEDLQIAKMVRSSFGKDIYDAAWGQFLRCVSLKAENAGRHAIAVDPRWTSQACAACGTIAKKTLDQRQHACESCGFVAHRDHNAALVILGRGLRPGQLTEAPIGV